MVAVGSWRRERWWPLWAEGRTKRGSRIPWFRAHIAVASDPGRLVAVHLVHSGLLAGWAAAMLLYEAVLTDASDPVFNPAWRQGSFVAPFPARLGCPPALLPAALLAHLCAAGLFLLAASWHWAFWDLDVFLARARVLALHFARIFGIHLALAGSACFLFGSYHLERVGVWTSDAFGGFGAARPLVASFSPAGAALLDYSAQVAHHLAAGVVLAAWAAAFGATAPRIVLKLASLVTAALLAHLCAAAAAGACIGVHVPALRASPGGRYRQQAAFGATAKRDHMNHPPDLVFAAGLIGLISYRLR